MKFSAFFTFIIGGIVIYYGAKPEEELKPFFGAFLWVLAIVMVTMRESDEKTEQEKQVKELINPTGYELKPLEAEKIINSYGRSFYGTEKMLAIPTSYLPYSKPRIRMAYYLYIASLIKLGEWDKKAHETLGMAYAQLSRFIDDKEAHELNKVHSIAEKGPLKENTVKQKEQKEKYLYFIKNRFHDFEARRDLDIYIKECQIS